ncbi:type IV secretion system protein TraC [Rhodanobacter sp. FW106-PBR-R2A-1-13]|uniref:type IV secretion system protein TraC n=1 Tax=Rhodanobacter sp. FW106-PBR-R2A-1-13 TaxID=3454845 RepID=UPI0034E3E96C
MGNPAAGLLFKLTQPLVSAVKLLFGGDPWPTFETEVMPGWLQAIGYLDHAALYQLDNHALGFAFTGPPMSGVQGATFEKLAGLLQGQLPTDTVMQFLLWTSPDMEATLTRYTLDRLRAEGDFLKQTCKQFSAYYRDGATNSVVKGNDIRLRDVRLVITGKIPVGKEPTDEDVRKVMEVRDVVSAGLRACGFQMEMMKPAAYLRFMQTVFNWRSDAAWRMSPVTDYDDDHALTEQILDFNNEVRVDENGLWLGSQRARVLSPKGYPSQAAFGQAYAYLGEVMSGSNGLRDPTLLCMNLWFRDRESEAASIQKETMWLTNQSGQAITRFRPEILDQKRSFDLASKQIGDGDRIIRMCFGMVVITPDEKTSLAAVANAQAYMRTFGFKMMEDKYLCAPMFGNFMPFGTDVVSHAALRRWKRTTARGAVPLLPVMAEWRGTGTPSLLLVSRNGQLMSLSNWDSDTNFNCAIAAESGSGKSFLAQTLLQNARMTGDRFWIVDKGKSYTNIVEMMGGQRLSFGPSSGLCLNPWTIVDDYEADEDLLYSLISAMAAMNDPLSDVQSAEVKRLMRLTFNSVGREAMTIDHLAHVLLQQTDPRIRDVGTQLHPFTREGGYGRLFYGRNNYEVDNPVILLELDDLEGRAHLQRVVLLQLMFQIRREMGRLPRTVRKYLLIDEAWELLAGNGIAGGADPVADFVGKAYRQFRKHGGGALTITQSISDYFQNEVTRTIWANSAHKWLLGQRPEAIEAAKREGQLDIGDHGFRLLRGVHTVKGEYSEIFMHTPQGYGVGRLIVPPVFRKLFSTTATDVGRIAEMRERGMPLMKAIEKLAIEDGLIAGPLGDAA